MNIIIYSSIFLASIIWGPIMIVSCVLIGAILTSLLRLQNFIAQDINAKEHMHANNYES
tara:strand:- start:669 stop:845 length:177 start_codon:yes stop_codon:yes gene_type:complete